jgi:hypothetical protein
MKVVCLKIVCLSCEDLPNHAAFCHAFGIIGKPLMSRGAPNWFFLFVWIDEYFGIMFQPIVEKWLNIEQLLY